MEYRTIMKEDGTLEKIPLGAKNGKSEQQYHLSASELSRLESLPKDDLLALVKRMACQCGIVAAMSEGQTFQAGLDRLAKLFLTLPDSESKEIGNTFDKWCDRTRGKPKQSIDTTVTVGIIEIVAEVERRRNQVIDVTPVK